MQRLQQGGAKRILKWSLKTRSQAEFVLLHKREGKPCLLHSTHYAEILVGR